LRSARDDVAARREFPKVFEHRAISQAIDKRETSRDQSFAPTRRGGVN
jgi:hypothetical protein